MPASDQLSYRRDEPAESLLPVLVAAITGGRRLLREPRLLHQLLLRARASTGSRPGETRRPDELWIPGLPRALQGELQRRASRHGLSYGAYVVAVLGQLASTPVTAVHGTTDEPRGRGQRPDLRLVIGTGPASSTSRT